MVKIHGKEYAEVKDRIPVFREKYPDWSIRSEVFVHGANFEWVAVHAWLESPDKSQRFDGWAYEERSPNDTYVNFSSWLENAETSAIGRALANMNIVLSTERPSAEEMKKVERFVKQKEQLATGIKGFTTFDSRAKMISEIDGLRKKLVSLTHKDQAYLQALENRKVDKLDLLQIKDLHELRDSLQNYLKLCEEVIGHDRKSISDFPEDLRYEVEEKLKMAMLTI